MKRFKWAETEEIARLSHIEVCPKAIDLTQEISKRIAIDGGGALIIDYGVNGIVSNSLQVHSFWISHPVHFSRFLKIDSDYSDVFLLLFKPNGNAYMKE